MHILGHQEGPLGGGNAALHDAAFEQDVAPRGEHVDAQADGGGALAKHRQLERGAMSCRNMQWKIELQGVAPPYRARVAAKGRNVVERPLHGQTLIKQGLVAVDILVVRKSQPTQSSDSVCRNKHRLYRYLNLYLILSLR